MTDALRLYAFNTGWFQCKPGYFVEGNEGDYLRGPVPDNKFGLQWFEGMDIATRLQAIDVDPAGIAFVINSHLHIDHCGGNAHFPNATVIVQASELDIVSTPVRF